MKYIKIILLFAWCMALMPQTYAQIPLRPEFYTPVVDEAHILNEGEVQRLAARIVSFQDTIHCQIALVTVPTLGSQSIEQFGNELFTTWGIGAKDKNAGVLILLAMAERQIRIEVGYGLEGTLPDAYCAAVIEQFMIPALRANQPYSALSAGIEQLMTQLRTPLSAEELSELLSVQDEPTYRLGMGASVFTILSCIFMSLLSFGVWGYPKIRKHRGLSVEHWVLELLMPYGLSAVLATVAILITLPIFRETGMHDEWIQGDIHLAIWAFSMLIFFPLIFRPSYDANKYKINYKSTKKRETDFPIFSLKTTATYSSSVTNHNSNNSTNYGNNSGASVQNWGGGSSGGGGASGSW